MKAQIAKAQALLNLKKPKTDKAIQLLNPLVKKKNAPWPVYHFAGIAFVQKGDYGMALSFLEEARKQGSVEPETYHAISICYFNMEEYDKAEEFSRKALNKNPQFFKGWLHLGALYRSQAKLNEALKCFQKANQIDPKSAGVAYRIGEIYNDQGDLNKAIELFEITIKIDKEYLNAYLAKAEILKKQRKYKDAEDTIYEVLSREPQNIAAKVSLGELYKHTGNYEKAMELYKRLIEKHPTISGIRVNYGLCLQELGEYDEAEKHYLKAFEDTSNSFEPISNYLMCMHYNPKRSKEEIFEAHKLWDQHFSPKKRPQRPVPANTSVNKKLRLGCISGGFRAHPVGWMITTALENLPGEEFEIYCYTTNNRYDKITKRIHAVSDRWQSVIGYNDEVIAQMIREDEIDILVELSGHSADTRLKTVALEPAPVAVKWVGGLFNTTGLRSVDYLLTDHFETPGGEEPFYTEKLVRMPDDYIVFLPPEYSPEVAELPLKKKGKITFGCFNNPTKVNDVTLKKWAEVMNQVPESELFLKSKQYDTKALRDRIINTMKECGISEDRLIFEGLSPHDELLECYNRVDIALDPWPYSGGLTTCEALWMGVPVVTKPGPTFAGRHSTTHLQNAGVPEWITDNWQQYKDKAVELASDPEKLANIRAGLRAKVAASPIIDGERFGAHLSKAFREMWKQRVAGYKTGTSEDQWKDHIEVKKLSEQEIRSRSKKKDVLETVDEIEADFMEKQIREVTKEAINEVPENGISNGHSAQSHDAPQKNEIHTETLKIQTKDGLTVCTPSDVNMLTPYVLLEQQQWYEKELDFIRNYLKPGMNFVDVGAGFGAYSLPAAKCVGKKGMIFSFEPGAITKLHLEKSKVLNDFDHLEVIDKALAAEPGKRNWKVAATPEFNKLDETGEKEILVTTLDKWWEFEGRIDIDMLKIDVNGDEEKILKGASQLLEETAPLLLISVSKENSLVDALKEKGYKIYEYIPGAGILADHEPETGVDPYLQNIIAVKEEKFEILKNDGWFHDESHQPEEPEVGLWQTYLAKLPWTGSLLKSWKSLAEREEHQNYLRALDYICAADAIETHSENKKAGSEKATLLLEAAGILIPIFNNGNSNTSVALVLTRVLNDLGKRGQAVEVMRTLIESTNFGQQNVDIELPFLLPFREQDLTSVKTDLPKWMMVRIVESWILLKDHTTNISGPQERKLLEVLEGNPEVIDRLDSFLKLKAKSRTESDFENGVVNTKKGHPKVIHVCFNHIYAQSLSDLVEHTNKHSDQEHRLFIETHRAISDYSVEIDNNPASSLFNCNNDLSSILNECLKDEVDMVIFHGIFFDWQKKLIKSIGENKHIGWVIWGGDLYNPIKNNELKNIPSHLISSVHTSVKGDRDLFSKYYGKVAEFDFAYPYPGLYGEISQNFPKKTEKRIIVGNSGDSSNNHIHILEELAKKKDIGDYRIILPVSYNFLEDYRTAIKNHIAKLGLERQVTFHDKFISPIEYLDFMASSEIFIAGHDRQQAMGNILMSLYLGNTTIFKKNITIHGNEESNPGWRFIEETGLKPTSFQEFCEVDKLKSITNSSNDQMKNNQKIINDLFGLDARMNELLTACSAITE